MEKFQYRYSLDPLYQTFKSFLDKPLVINPDYVNKQSEIVDIIYLLGIQVKNSEQATNRLAEITLELINANVLDIVLLKERLDLNFLEKLHLSDQSLTEKSFAKYRTALLFTHSSFNLLAEETEGYSKLLIELSENLPQPLDIFWNNNKKKSIDSIQELRNSIIIDHASCVMTNIIRIIGVFDLNPSRVLDIILHVFASSVIDYWEFFIQLLEVSPWGPDIVLIDGKQTRVPKLDFAQILGFKLKDSQNTDELFWVAALLIKHQFVGIDGLYAHLSLSADEYNNQCSIYQKNLAKRSKKAGRFVVPTMSGSLDDDADTSAAPVVDINQEEPLSETPNQIASLLDCLLAVGDIQNSSILLARFEKLPQMYPEISKHICRLLHVFMEIPLNEIRPLKLNVSGSYSSDSSPPINSLDVPMFGREWTGNDVKNKFFYEKWKSDIVKYKDLNEIVNMIEKWIGIVGPNLYLDVLLVGKLIRLGHHHITVTNHDSDVKLRWLTIISRYIFPAISQLQSNPGIAHQLWNLVELWPYSTRYALYGEWKHVTYKSIPELKIPLMGCEKDCRYILARLSKETVKQYGRHIGKVVHSNPTLAFSKIIKQLESYENMVSHVVDATRYLTNFELDVMIYCLLEALGDSRKARVEDNGQSISSWLKSLSSFTGSLLKRHSVDLSGLLQYFAAQLTQNNVYDLVILQEVVGSMTGIKAMEDVTANQLRYLAGDRHLRRLGLLFESINVTKNSTERLVQELRKSNLTLQIGILIGQQCEEIAFRYQSSELKISAWLNDHCLKSFLQYFEFVTSQFDYQVYGDLVPGINELLETYKLSAPFAFHILRPKISSMAAKANDLEQRKCLMRDLVGQVEGCFEPAMFENMSADLFTNFWSLSLYDVEVPTKLYDEEIEKIRKGILEVDAKKDYSAGKKAREKEAFETLILKLEQESQKQEDNFACVSACLLETSAHCFDSASAESYSDLAAFTFIQNCIYPRALISPADAIFCARFVEKLQIINTPNFSTYTLYSKLFSKSAFHAMLFSLTETESKNFGWLLWAVLQTLASWQSNHEVYEEATGSKTAFQKNVDAKEIYSYDEFRNILLSWHLQLLQCFLKCLDSNEYMQMRNSIIVLEKISDYFPATKENAALLESKIENIVENESRNDLKLMARAFKAKLLQKKSSWVTGASFLGQPEPSTPVKETVDADGAKNESNSNTNCDPEDVEMKVEEDAEVEVEVGEIPETDTAADMLIDSIEEGQNDSFAKETEDSKNRIENSETGSIKKEYSTGDRRKDRDYERFGDGKDDYRRGDGRDRRQDGENRRFNDVQNDRRNGREDYRTSDRREFRRDRSAERREDRHKDIKNERGDHRSRDKSDDRSNENRRNDDVRLHSSIRTDYRPIERRDDRSSADNKAHKEGELDDSINQSQSPVIAIINVESQGIDGKNVADQETSRLASDSPRPMDSKSSSEPKIADKNLNVREADNRLDSKTRQASPEGAVKSANGSQSIIGSADEPAVTVKFEDLKSVRQKPEISTNFAVSDSEKKSALSVSMITKVNEQTLESADDVKKLREKALGTMRSDKKLNGPTFKINRTLVSETRIEDPSDIIIKNDSPKAEIGSTAEKIDPSKESKTITKRLPEKSSDIPDTTKSLLPVTKIGSGEPNGIFNRPISHRNEERGTMHDRSGEFRAIVKKEYGNRDSHYDQERNSRGSLKRSDDRDYRDWDNRDYREKYSNDSYKRRDDRDYRDRDSRDDREKYSNDSYKRTDFRDERDRGSREYQDRYSNDSSKRSNVRDDRDRGSRDRQDRYSKDLIKRSSDGDYRDDRKRRNGCDY